MKKLIPIIVLFFAIFAFAQEKPQAVLVDEFGKVHCDELLARVDNFFIQKHNDADAHTYYVIDGSDNYLREKLGMEQLFRTAVRQRGYDSGGVTIVRSTSADPLKIQMWLVPTGARRPEFQLGAPSLVLHAAKPFLLSTDYDGICDPAPLEPVARDLLDANPKGMIYAVIYGDTPLERRIELNKATKSLASFPRSQLRYILRPANGRFGSDYWFIVGNPTRREVQKW